MRYARPNKSTYKVLEIGCGSGANIPFFIKLGVDYYAVDGSNEIIERMHEMFPQLADHIVQSDFTKQIPFDVEFDLIVDRASLTHNGTSDILQSLEIIYSRMNTDAKYIGIDWFSTVHSEYGNGIELEDRYTRGNYQSGQFANLGKVHFSDKEHLLNLFANFSMLFMEHKTIERELPDEGYLFGSWNFVAQKVGN
jgi:SAM-dependent methyltransferase